MSLLTFSGVGFAYAPDMILFENVSFSVDPGDRIAVVGPNGAGKSTFLRLLAADLEPTRGSIAWRRGLNVRASWQHDPETGQSGGEQQQERLSSVLREDPDLLILDEPTNHLDLRARQWLERLLSDRRGTTIVASHDRAFLAAFATRVIDIERGDLRVYGGGYPCYREKKEQITAQQWAEYTAYERRKHALDSAAAKRDRLAGKVASAPEGARHSHDFYRRKAGKVARTGRLLRERVHDPEVAVNKPWEEQPISTLTFENVRRGGDFVLQAERLTIPGLFQDLSFHLWRGDRLVVTGPNGSGKSTLLRVLSGDQQAGGQLRLGANVGTASISQTLERQFDFDLSPLALCGNTTGARTLLACLKVPHACLHRPLQTLSGGERTKVAIASMLNSSANLLLLDEPTNHLETQAQEALEEALRLYPGTVIAVSHDRAFLEALGPRAQRIELPYGLR